MWPVPGSFSAWYTQAIFRANDALLRVAVGGCFGSDPDTDSGAATVLSGYRRELDELLQGLPGGAGQLLPAGIRRDGAWWNRTLSSCSLRGPASRRTR